MGLEEKQFRSFLSEKIYTYSLALWSVMNVVFTYSTFSEKLGLPLSSYLYYVDIIVIGLLFFKIFIGNLIYTQKQLIVSAILLSAGLLIYYSTGSRAVLMLMLFIISAKDVDIEKVLLSLYRFELITVGLIIVLSLLNYIPNKISSGIFTSEHRFCLGFVHPNSCGFALINVVLLHFYTHRKHIAWYHFLLLFAALFIDYRWPKSKTVYYVLIFVFIALVFLKISSSGFKKLFAKFLRIVPFLIVIFTVIIVVMYNNNSSFSITVNETFTQRISQMSYYMENYSVKLFGQYLEVVSSSQATTINEMRVLDNAYLNCLLGYGIVVTLLFIIGYYKLLKQSIRVKDYYKLILLIAIFIWGFSETAMIKLECNSLLILFAGCLYSKSESKNAAGLVQNKCQA